MWLMNGSTIASSSAPVFNGSPVMPDASWSIVEIGDFTGNGNTDLLWRQNGTGALSEWIMDGTRIVASVTPQSQGSPISPDATWQVPDQPTNFP
jgi:hypothetical protein